MHFVLLQPDGYTENSHGATVHFLSVILADVLTVSQCLTDTAMSGAEEKPCSQGTQAPCKLPSWSWR